MISCDFHRVITISDKIDVGPLETIKKLNILKISQVCHECQWADTCVRVLSSQRSSKPDIGVLFTTLSDFLSTDKTLYNPLSL